MKILLQITYAFFYILGYLKKHKFSCNFSFSCKETITRHVRRRFLNLHVSAEGLHLASCNRTLQWNPELSSSSQNRVFDGSITSIPAFYFQQKWRLKIKDLLNIALGISLPIFHDLILYSNPIFKYLHFIQVEYM